MSNSKIIKFDTLDSTNTYSKNNIENLNNLDIVFTFEQTNGHGRTSHIWKASKDSLAFSIIIKDKFFINNFEAISLISAVSVLEALSKYLSNLSIKWPNDVLVNGKKICGILMESISYDEIIGLIVGIGVNVNNNSFHQEISSTATSLFLETNHKFDVEEIRDLIVTSFIKHLEKLKNNDHSYIDIINKYNYLYGKKAYANINGENKYITVDKILPNNHLKVVLDDNSTQEVSTGEISFHINK